MLRCYVIAADTHDGHGHMAWDVRRLRQAQVKAAYVRRLRRFAAMPPRRRC